MLENVLQNFKDPMTCCIEVKGQHFGASAVTGYILCCLKFLCLPLKCGYSFNTAQISKNLFSVVAGYLRHDMDKPFTAPVLLTFFTNVLSTEFMLGYEFVKII